MMSQGALAVARFMAKVLDLFISDRFRECPLLAQSGHLVLHRTCPLSGVKRTSRGPVTKSAFDPKRTLTLLDLGPTRLPKLSHQ